MEGSESISPNEALDIFLFKRMIVKIASGLMGTSAAVLAIRVQDYLESDRAFVSSALYGTILQVSSPLTSARYMVFLSAFLAVTAFTSFLYLCIWKRCSHPSNTQNAFNKFRPMVLLTIASITAIVSIILAFWITFFVNFQAPEFEPNVENPEEISESLGITLRLSKNSFVRAILALSWIMVATHVLNLVLEVVPYRKFKSATKVNSENSKPEERQNEEEVIETKFGSQNP